MSSKINEVSEIHVIKRDAFCMEISGWDYQCSNASWATHGHRARNYLTYRYSPPNCLLSSSTFRPIDFVYLLSPPTSLLSQEEFKFL